MDNKKKKLIVVGDRVLVLPAEGEERTSVGLFLPKTALDGQSVQGGKIVAKGPGIPMGDPGENEDEPWKQSGRAPKYFPMQAREGDWALFFRRAAIEIKFDGKDYLVVPHAAILVLIREGEVVEDVASESGEWKPGI
jgi:co-chaperonin GroES (HSP10)